MSGNEDKPVLKSVRKMSLANLMHKKQININHHNYNNTATLTSSEQALAELQSENLILQSKLQSKVEALAIMSQQLEKCTNEKERYRMLGEQLYKRITANNYSNNIIIDYHRTSPDYSVNTGAHMLAITNDQNKLLNIQVETLKHKLKEAEEDLRVLRNQKIYHQSNSEKYGDSKTQESFNFQREELVKQLEISKKKAEHLQADIRSLLDEKEDLITERDAYKCKLHRLNHQLMIALSKKNKKSDSGIVLDIDALIMENRYLQERLNQVLAEKELATATMSKYKNALESKHQKGVLKLGTNNANTVVTHKQVRELLDSTNVQDLPVTAATIADLRSLSIGLLDSLNDKSLALSHQKKANKILAARISDLEKWLENSSDNEEKCLSYPSNVFLENYHSSEVDNYEVPVLETAEDKNEIVKEQQMKFHNPSESDQDDQLPPELEKLFQEALKQVYNDGN